MEQAPLPKGIAALRAELRTSGYGGFTSRTI